MIYEFSTCIDIPTKWIYLSKFSVSQHMVEVPHTDTSTGKHQCRTGIQWQFVRFLCYANLAWQIQLCYNETVIGWQERSPSMKKLGGTSSTQSLSPSGCTTVLQYNEQVMTEKDGRAYRKMNCLSVYLFVMNRPVLKLIVDTVPDGITDHIILNNVHHIWYKFSI